MNTNMQPQTEAVDIRAFFAALQKNILLIALLALSFGAAGLFGTQLLVTPLYQAKASMIVNADPTQSRPTVTSDQINSAKQLVDTYAVLLTSSRMTGRIRQDLGISLTDQELAGRISISAVNNTQIMQLTVSDPSPTQAQAIAQSLVENAPAVIAQMTDMDSRSVKTVADAVVGSEPVNLHPLRNGLIGLLLGSALGIGVSVLRVMLNNRFLTDEDVRRQLNLPVLGVIPVTDTAG